MSPRVRRLPVRRTRIDPASRGITSILAMLYLMLFSAMALGFYAQVIMSVQTSASEQRCLEALAAAQSGVHFVRYHLSDVAMPPALTPDRAFEELGMQLCDRLNGSANMAGGSVYADPSEI